MIRIRYNLQKKNNPHSLIMLSIKWGTPDRIQKSVGLTIPTKNWDFNKCRVKNHIHSVSYNKILNKIEEELSNLYHEQLSLGVIVSKNTLNDKFLDLRNNGVDENKKRLKFLDIFKKFELEYRVNGIRPAKKTIEKYHTTISKLTEYEKEKGTLLNFQEINEDFYNSFFDFLVGKGNNNNTIGTDIRVLKTFMKWSKNRKYHNTTEYEKFKVVNGITKNRTVLTKEELYRIEDYVPFSNEEEFAKLFILTNCSIGLRASDLLIIIRDYNVEMGVHGLIQKKTQQRQLIDLDKKVLDRINRMKELYLPHYTLARINKHMRIIAKKLGMNREENIPNQVGNTTVYNTVKRYELITSHVCRRTFVTLSLMKGEPIAKIMKFTGHKTLTSFQLYLNTIDYVDNKPIRDLW